MNRFAESKSLVPIYLVGNKYDLEVDNGFSERPQNYESQTFEEKINSALKIYDSDQEIREIAYNNHWKCEPNYSCLADADGSEIERILISLCKDLPGNKKSHQHRKIFQFNNCRKDSSDERDFGGSTDTLTDLPVRANVPGSFRHKKEGRRQSVFQSISSLFHK